MVRRGAAALVVALFVALAATDASAQEATADIQPRLIPVGSVAELTIEVDPGGMREHVEEPALPPLPSGVSIVGRARESRVEMRGLDVRRTVVFRYSIQGNEAGTVRIEPVSVRIGDAVRRTEPVVLLVVGNDVGPAVASGGAPPIFVSARVDRERAWVGEQVTLTFAFYHDPSVPLSESPDYDPPDTPGFWRVELSTAPEIASERVAGRVYQVQRFRYALFPLQEGTAEIGPARVRIVQPDPERWWEPGRPRTLATDPLTVRILDLPTGAPPGFGGAVGRFSLTGGAPQGEASVGSPLELSLTVRGNGNPATVDAPELPDWPGIDVGDPSVETEQEFDGMRLGGRATFRWILVPRTEGRLTLGVARLPYFDPAAGAYATDTLRLGELEVRPGTPDLAGPARSRTPRGPTLWEPREPSAPWPRGLASSPLLWAALAIPWLGWLALTAWSNRRRMGGRERGDAAADARRARRALADEDSGSEEARVHLSRALTHRFGSDHAGLPSRERRERWRRTGADEAVIDAAEAAIEALDASRFAGADVERARDALARLADVLDAERNATRSTGAGILLVLLAALAGLLPPRAAPAQTPMEQWAEANRAYREGELAGASRGFADLARRFEDSRIEANLAASLWRQGLRGEALAAYRRALRLAPRNTEIRSDAARLRSELGSPPEEDPLARALGSVRLDELLLALAIGNALAAATVLGRARGRVAAPIPAAACALTVLLAAVTGLHAWTVERPERAIALAGATLASAPDGTPIGPLPEGALIEVLARENASARVRMHGHPAGWVAVDRIAPLD